MKKIYQGIANWMPKKLLYFTVIRAWAIVTTKKGFTHRTPDSVTWIEVVKELEK